MMICDARSPLFLPREKESSVFRPAAMPEETATIIILTEKKRDVAVSASSLMPDT